MRVSALNCLAKPKSPAVWACLGIDPLDILRTPYRASEGKRFQSITHQPCPITPTLTSSSVDTSFISSIDYNVFILLGIQCHLKDPLCRKVT